MPATPGVSLPVFATTRWSVVLAAQGTESPVVARALEQLCGAYWYPLYAQVRRRGHAPAEAEDLTQSFFARFLEKDWLAGVQPARGRFRSFLLAALQHFLSNEGDRARALKRGGGIPMISLDARVGEERFGLEPATPRTPEQDFDRCWALALLDTVLGRLEREYAAQGKARLFGCLKGTVGGDIAELSGAQLAAELGLSEGAVRVAAHRLRQRYREVLREEIAQTVATPGEIEDELRHLLAAVSN